MLEFAGVSAADGDDAAINVQLTDDGHASFQLRPKGLRGAAPQTQQADQDVLLRILVGQEGLPAAIGNIIPPNQLHLNAHVSVSERDGLCAELRHTTALFWHRCSPLPGKAALCGGSPECPLLGFSRLDTAHKEKSQSSLKTSWSHWCANTEKLVGIWNTPASQVTTSFHTVVFIDRDRFRRKNKSFVHINKINTYRNPVCIYFIIFQGRVVFTQQWGQRTKQEQPHWADVGVTSQQPHRFYCVENDASEAETSVLPLGLEGKKDAVCVVCVLHPDDQ